MMDPSSPKSPLSNFWNRPLFAPLALLTLSLPLFFFQSGGWAFFDPDEGRYAEIPREMLARGDWITPTLNYTPYFEKPPLFYWSVAASFRAFGLHEWAARLVPALAALAGLFLVYGLGRRIFNARAGVLGAVVLATTLFWPAMARIVAIDMQFSVLLVAALAFWWLGHTDEAPRRNGYFFAFWLALALAVLAKGPVAVVLAGGAIFVYLLLCRQWKALRAMGWWWGVPLFLLVSAPWFVLVAERNPGFNHYFWYGQHIGRFLGAEGNREHDKGFFYFFTMLPLLFFPWTLFWPAAVLHGWKKLWPARSEKQRATIFLLVCALVIFVFFTISTSKLVTYILPVFPFVALLLGAYFDRLLPRFAQSSHGAQRAFWCGALALAGVLVIAVAAAILKGPKLAVYIGAANLAWDAVVIAVFFWLALLGVALWRRCRAGTVAAVALGFTVFFAAAMPLIGAVAANRQVAPLLESIRPGLRAGADILLYQNLTQSVGFYTRRRVRIIGNAGEITFGQKQLPPEEQRRWFVEGDEAHLQDALRRALDVPQPVYAVVGNHGIAQELAAKIDGVQEIAWNKYRSIIGNRAAAKLTPRAGESE